MAKKKLSAKQVKYFGTKAQKAALKRKGGTATKAKKKTTSRKKTVTKAKARLNDYQFWQKNKSRIGESYEDWKAEGAKRSVRNTVNPTDYELGMPEPVDILDNPAEFAQIFGTLSDEYSLPVVVPGAPTGKYDYIPQADVANAVTTPDDALLAEIFPAWVARANSMWISMTEYVKRQGINVTPELIAARRKALSIS